MRKELLCPLGHRPNIQHVASQSTHANTNDSDVKQTHHDTNQPALARPTDHPQAMAGNNYEKDGLSSQPSSEPKIGRKHLNAPKPIVVPDSCKTTPDGSLDSPWMRLGYDIGLNLTDARTPEHKNHQGNSKPTCQLKENASAAELKHTSSKKKVPSIKQKRAATSSSNAFAPNRPKKSGVKRNTTP